VSSARLKIQPLNRVLLIALVLLPGLAFAEGSGAPLLATFTNLNPAAGGFFGGAVAAVGTDRVLIGHEDAGAAYLFSLNGTLLTTFTNAPSFGQSVAAVGIDRVLIGAHGYSIPTAAVGAAFLFSTNGALLTTFTNPSPATVEEFGISVAAVGSDRVIISGLADVNQPGPYPGAVYLFNTNGALVLSFLDPTPADDGGFGASLAALGNDRIVIGAPYKNTGATGAGSAYLYRTNGTLLTTFTNPSPASVPAFGASVAAIGADRVLIRAVNGPAGGKAYLFNTNGVLLITFDNPTPASGDSFGQSVATVGNSRVLIGALQDSSGAFHAGSAYLFSTNGTLLTTITNPTPETSDFFGYAVTAAGTDQVFVSAPFDNTAATHAGAAYLFALPYPPLSIARNASTLSVRWITAETGLLLQQTDLLGASSVWSNTTNPVSINGATNIVQQTASGTTNRFFRLRRP
jgi:hypothetical protein